MVATIQLKQGVAKACIFDIFICKLSYQLEISLIVLVKVDKSLKINLYNIVLTLNLVINLRIKSS